MGLGVGVGVVVLDEIKAISAPSWDLAWAWAELGNIFLAQKLTKLEHFKENLFSGYL